MKFLVIAVLVTACSVLSQTAYLSCSGYGYCEFDGKQPKNCSYTNEKSMIRLNSGSTILTHTTGSLESNYYVQSQVLIKQDSWQLETISDVGNEYTWFLYLSEKKIIAIPKSNAYAIVYDIITAVVK